MNDDWKFLCVNSFIEARVGNELFPLASTGDKK